MKQYQEPMITVTHFTMTDRITFEDAEGELLPGTTYSENVELWD